MMDKSRGYLICQVQYLKQCILLYFSFLLFFSFSKLHAQSIPLHQHSWLELRKPIKLSDNLKLSANGYIRTYYPNYTPNFVALRPIFSYSFSNNQNTIFILPFSINSIYSEELSLYSRSYIGWRVNVIPSINTITFRQLIEYQNELITQDFSSIRFRNMLTYRERWNENLDLAWSLELLNKRTFIHSEEWINSIRFYNDFYTKIFSTSLILGWMMEWNSIKNSYYFASNIRIEI